VNGPHHGREPSSHLLTRPSCIAIPSIATRSPSSHLLIVAHSCLPCTTAQLFMTCILLEWYVLTSKSKEGSTKYSEHCDRKNTVVLAQLSEPFLKYLGRMGSDTLPWAQQPAYNHLIIKPATAGHCTTAATKNRPTDCERRSKCCVRCDYEREAKRTYEPWTIIFFCQCDFSSFHLSISLSSFPISAQGRLLEDIMTSERTTDDHFQEFRIQSTSSSTPVSDNTILIPSWLDKKTGERIVLWRDIQNEISDAHRVRNGKRSVTFMMDDEFNE
jgi:hypothetical protein